MSHYLPKLGVLAAALVILCPGQVAQAGPIQLMKAAAATQNFNALARTPEDANVAWTNDGTIAAWFSNRTTYRVSDGRNFNASLYSFGPVNNMDRALGGITNSNITPIFFGADIQNKTGEIITDLKIEYVGEQWRLGSAGAQTLAFTIDTNPFFPADTPVTQLDFTSPKTGGTGTNLDGNAAANRTAKAHTITMLEIFADQIFKIKWTLTNPRVGLSHGLGIDDLKITVIATKPIPEPIPEPSSVVLLAIGTLTLLAGQRLRRARRMPSTA